MKKYQQMSLICEYLNSNFGRRAAGDTKGVRY